MNGHVAYLDGGLECELMSPFRIASTLTNGSSLVDTREIMPINEAQIRSECQKIKDKGINDIAIVGIFSPLDTEGKQEATVRRIVLEEIPGADVVLSSEGK